MAPGSHFCRNASPCSVGYNDPDVSVATRTPTKYTKEDLRTMTSSAWIHSSRLKPVIPNPQATKKAFEKCKDHVDTNSAFDTNCILFVALFLHVEDPLPWVEFKISLQRVWMAQGLVCIPPGVALDKIPSGKKFTIGRLTTSILNPSGLMLIAPEKPDLIRFLGGELKPLVKALIK